MAVALDTAFRPAVFLVQLDVCRPGLDGPAGVAGGEAQAPTSSATRKPTATPR